MNLYKILNVNRSSSLEEIKKSYKKLVLKYHPDKNDGKIHNEYYAVVMSYNILSDPDKRSKYDKTGYINDYDGNGKINNTYNSFFNTINGIFDTLFNKQSNNIYDELKNDKLFWKLVNEGKAEEAKNYLSEIFNSKVTSTSSYNIDSESSNISNINYLTSDIVIEVSTSIDEVIKGMFKVISFQRQCFKNNNMIVEDVTLTIPIHDDRVIYENEGHDYISDDGLLVRGRVIFNINCTNNTKIKRVNDYDIMIVSKINDFELNHGYKKKFKVIDKYINIVCDDPINHVIDDKITIKVEGKGIKYYEGGDNSKPLYGSLYLILFTKI